METKSILRAKTLAKRLDVSISKLYTLVKQPDFPPRIYLTPTCVGWDSALVDAWVESKTASKPTAQAGG